MRKKGLSGIIALLTCLFLLTGLSGGTKVFAADTSAAAPETATQTVTSADSAKQTDDSKKSESDTRTSESQAEQSSVQSDTSSDSANNAVSQEAGMTPESVGAESTVGAGENENIVPESAEGWQRENGEIYYYRNGAKLTGWFVTDISPSGADTGLERYFLAADGALAVDRLVPASEAGYDAYADANGVIARGKKITSDGRIYLADNAGMLESAGWLVTKAYDGGYQRYYIDETTRCARLGSFEVAGNNYYGIPGSGYVLRGISTMNGFKYYADNDGVLCPDGWFITDVFGQGLQRYWFMDGRMASAGLIQTDSAGNYAYVQPEGYVVRGKYFTSAGDVYLADNDGKLEAPGWRITSAYDGGLQRYYIDGTTHGAKLGKFVVDGINYYGISGSGYVLRGALRVNGNAYYADNDGVLRSNGWLITDAFGQGLQRYWFNSDCVMAPEGLVRTDSEGNYAFVRPEGYVVRGKYVAFSGDVYIADNDGKLESPGFHITDAYDGGFQRYFVDADRHNAKTGFFTVNGQDYYGVPSQGYELRGKYKYNSVGMLLADNDGVLQGFPSGLGGWLVTDKYDGTLERYRIDDCCDGHAGAHLGLFELGGDLYYGLNNQGYEMRNIIDYINGTWYAADNDGVLTVTTPPVLASMTARAQGYSSPTSYLLMVDKSDFKFVVFRGSSYSWEPLYFWDCGIGKPSTPTIEGVFHMGIKESSFGHGYTCYWACQILGDYLIHSGLYNEGTMEPQAIEMRTATSGGCVRLEYDNAYWVYHNVPSGTTIVIY